MKHANYQQFSYDSPVSNLQACYILDILPCGIILLDASGTIIEANYAATKLLGTSLLGRLWVTVIAHCVTPREDDGHEVSLSDGRRISIDIQSLYPVAGELILLTDLTHTRVLEQARNQQQRLAEMGKMTAQIAHQIRTPLTSAILYLDQLSQKNLLKEQDVVQHIKNCHSSIEQQLRDMLIFAQGGQSPLQSVSLRDFCSQISNASLALLSQYHAQLEIHCQLDISIQCHTESLKGAILNLIENSLQANASTIKFAVKLISFNKLNYLEFTIQDNGKGMTQQVQQQALQAFFTTRSHGIGLGLGVVQAVVQAHAGELEIDSTPELGTTVVLRIPWLTRS